jgi:nicotinic acid mononucleotide adenylyltransferase
MLRRAVAPHPQFGVLELVDVSFSVERTLPRLRQEFPDDQLVFLFGSDVVPGLAAWPHVDRLLASTELVIGLRAREKDDARDNGDIYSDSDIRDNNVYIGDQHIREDHDRLRQIIEAWPTPPQVLTMFPSYAPDVSSGRVREALRHGQPGQPVKGLLSSVERYSDRHWLYVSLA